MDIWKKGDQMVEFGIAYPLHRYFVSGCGKGLVRGLDPIADPCRGKGAGM